ncbi:hypothetical protein BH10PSE19_BH10PSE19_16850 [soil metagenome]
MDSHLSVCKNEGQANRRNGKLKKTIKTTPGSFELGTPRDRDGSFEPEIIKKHQTVLNESLDNKVLSLYALGMSYEAITEHLADMYGLDVSTAKISLITDKLMPVITEWRNRPLEAVYPIIFLDAMHFPQRRSKFHSDRRRFFHSLSQKILPHLSVFFKSFCLKLGPLILITSE